MSESKSLAEVRNLPIFRNASDVRIFYLLPREKGQQNFLLKPGMTVQALNEDEATLLASMSDLRDVAKETPEIAMSLANLEQQLAEEKAKNVALLKKNNELEAATEKTTRTADAASVRTPARKTR